MIDESAHQNAPSIFNWEIVRKALRAGAEGVFCWQINSDHIFYTEQCLKMMGLPFHLKAPNIFTEPEKTIHPDDLKYFTTSVKQYIERWRLRRNKKLPLRIEVRLLNLRARGWKWIRINGVLDKDEENKVERFVGIWVDITRRKMADMNALIDRDLFRQLINHLPDNIYFKNRDSHFIMANDATARKMGVATPSDLIGRSDYHFFDESMSKIARREEEEIIKTGRPITSRLHKETWKGNKTTWSQISKFPLTDTNGNITGIVGISSDVTKLVLAQQQAQELAAKLERRKRELEDELKLARDIQQALIPNKIPTRKLPFKNGKIRSANFHHIFKPATGVAGDCFEVFSVGDAGVGIIICDVMGHDISAALIASMLRGILGQFASLADTPALLLSALNQNLCKLFSQSNINMFTTACYVYIDMEKSRLTLSSAGHSAPIVVDEDGKAALPPLPRSPALGLRNNLQFRESEVKLKPGMKVMLYTDGLTEASNAAGDEIGASRILSYLNERSHEDIKELLAHSMDAMKDFIQDMPQSDDICLLGVEFQEKDTLSTQNDYILDLNSSEGAEQTDESFLLDRPN